MSSVRASYCIAACFLNVAGLCSEAFFRHRAFFDLSCALRALFAAATRRCA